MVFGIREKFLVLKIVFPVSSPKIPCSARVDVERPYGELSNSSVKTKPKKPNAPAVTREAEDWGSPHWSTRRLLGYNNEAAPRRGPLFFSCFSRGRRTQPNLARHFFMFPSISSWPSFS
jgi:hypothetical protein